MSCLGLVFLVMGPVLLLTAWSGGRSPVLVVGSLAYVLVGAWILLNAARRRRQL